LEGIDVDETFNLIVKPRTIQAVLSLATSQHCRTPIDTESKQGDDVRHACLYMNDHWEPHFLALNRILRTEAEYRGLANAVAETCWLQNLLLQHQQSKHIEIDIHFVRDLVATGQEFRTSLSVRYSPAPTRKYAVEILERDHMANCNSSRTPIDTESKQGDDVRHACLYMHDPREPHFLALNRILRTEAEYRGLANAVAETCWLQNLLLQHQQSKHIEIDIHFV
nr:hypothetical protein [Tanacetum cinerariifolium]